MIIIVDKHFNKQVLNCTNGILKKRLLALVEFLIICEKIQDIPNLKKMIGHSNYYRIRVGEYRVGIELEAPNTIRLICFEHRRKIYTVFP